jgi:hypothetical protein
MPCPAGRQGGGLLGGESRAVRSGYATAARAHPANPPSDAPRCQAGSIGVLRWTGRPSLPISISTQTSRRSTAHVLG